MMVWFDGALRAAAEAAIHIDDPGFLSGDGVFETALLHDGGFFRLNAHLDRFAASAAMLRLDVPPRDELADIAHRVVQRNGLRDARLRLTLTRGVDHPVLLVTARAHRLGQPNTDTGWRVITAAARRPSIAAFPAELKALGRTHALLARIEAADAGVDQPILLAEDGCVCEGPTWNVFWRTGRILWTPSVHAGALPGITRAALLELAAGAGFDVRQVRAYRGSLDEAEEIFASMTSAGIMPVVELDGRPIPGPGIAAATLLPAYLDLVEREAAADRAG